MENTIDLNCDLGESFGPWSMGEDEAMMEIVSSVNIACGGHAGDPVTMSKTVEMAKAKGLTIGAHPGYDDKPGFGRRIIPMSGHEIETMMAFQIGGLLGIAARLGAKVSYVKPHGAINNLAARDYQTARALAKAVFDVDKELHFLAVSGSELERAAKDMGLQTHSEIFADRAYEDDGQLVNRAKEGAVLHDADKVASRMTSFVQDGQVTAISGKKLNLAMHSICVHGDTKGAVSIAREVKAGLEKAGITIGAFCS